jgi:DNA-binding NtrC family response regulator
MTRVLLVDDETDFTEALEHRLRLRGLEVRSVGGGEAALESLAKEACDVVVLDVKMPDMSGLEVLHEIKRLHPTVEVIMLTGHASVDMAVEGMDAGAFDYLMKPTDLEELLHKIEGAREAKELRTGGGDPP